MAGGGSAQRKYMLIYLALGGAVAACYYWGGSGTKGGPSQEQSWLLWLVVAMIVVPLVIWLQVKLLHAKGIRLRDKVRLTEPRLGLSLLGLLCVGVGALASELEFSHADRWFYGGWSLFVVLAGLGELMHRRGSPCT